MLYRYRLYFEDGSEAGEAHYAVRIAAGEIVWTGDGRKWRVVEVVPADEENLPSVGFRTVASLAR